MARGEDSDVAWVVKYEDKAIKLYGRGDEEVCAGLLSVSESIGSNSTSKKVLLLCRNSKTGKRTRHASMGLQEPLRWGHLLDVCITTYWFLNNSRGGSTGVEDKAWSRRRDTTKEVNAEAMVGGESSEIAWYALNMAYIIMSNFLRVWYNLQSKHSLDCSGGSKICCPTDLPHESYICCFRYSLKVWIELCGIRFMEIRE